VASVPTTYSPLIFGGIINSYVQGGGPTTGVYFTFGLGISNQYNGPITGTNLINVPLIMPVQFSSSNSAANPTTQPNDIYVRVPGSGPRTIRALRWSIEYSIESATVTPLPAFIGLWTGPNPSDDVTPPVITRSTLFQQFPFGSNASKFQQGANLVPSDAVTVNGGDYISIALVISGSPDINLIYVSGSVEISNST
jgi:hypothetical protein